MKKNIKDFITIYYKMIVIATLKFLIIINTIGLIVFIILLTLKIDLISLLGILLLLFTLIIISTVIKKVESKLRIN